MSSMALAFIVCLATPYAHAAKIVPTIRIEIPKKSINEDQQGSSTSPLRTTPTIPLSEDDLTPSIDKLDEEEFTDEQVETEIRTPTQIFYGDKDLPEVVKELRTKLLDIAHSGEIEKLRTIFEAFTEPPLLSFEDEGDPIEFLKSSSGDGEGREILAILLEILESGYIRRDENDDGDIYIWPYFVDVPPEDLTARQIVELFRIITAGDFEDMKAYGTYIFYRVGITPDGQLKFFVAGD